jgi:hypothetical protein
MLIARVPCISMSRPLACGSFRGSPTTPCWPRLALLCGYGTHQQPCRGFSAHLSWLLDCGLAAHGRAWALLWGRRVLPWSLLAHSPARGALPMAHRVALVFATTLWLAGYSMPSLVTRRRRRVTYFAFPFGTGTACRWASAVAVEGGNWSARCGVRCNLHGCIGEGRAKRGFGQRCSSVRSARQRADARPAKYEPVESRV